MSSHPRSRTWRYTRYAIATAIAIASALAAISVFGPVARRPASEHASATSRDGSEPKLYSVDFNATGPLTLDELKINFSAVPDLWIWPWPNGRREACVLGQVKSLAARAGDPTTLDPGAVKFLPAGEEWARLDAVYKRILLAQAIVSEAFVDCP